MKMLVAVIFCVSLIFVKVCWFDELNGIKRNWKEVLSEMLLLAFLAGNCVVMWLVYVGFLD